MEKVSVKKLINSLAIIPEEMPIALEERSDSTFIIHIGTTNIIYPKGNVQIFIIEVCKLFDRLKFDLDLEMKRAIAAFLNKTNITTH